MNNLISKLRNNMMGERAHLAGVVNNVNEATHFDVWAEWPYDGPQVLLTHGGKNIHADETLATALILYAYVLDYTDILIVRLNNPTEENINEIIDNNNCRVWTYDIGRIYDPEDDKFDHHQSNAPTGNDGHKLCSAGQLLNYFESEGRIKPEVAKKLRSSLFDKIDVADNGGKSNDITDTVRSMNFQWNENPTQEEINERFLDIVEFMYEILDSRIKKIKAELAAKAEISNMTTIRPDPRGGAYVVSDKFIPHNVVFENNKSAYYVCPSEYNEGYWSLMSRHGLHIDHATAGENGCTFVHTAKFVATFNTKEAAIAAAELELKCKLEERLSNN